MIENIAKIEIVGERKNLDDVIAVLHELGVAHLETSIREEGRRITPVGLNETEKEEKEKLRSLLSDIKEIEEYLEIKGEADEEIDSSREEIEVEVEKMKREVFSLRKEEREKVEKMRSLSDYRAILKVLLPILKEKKKEGFTYIGVTLPRTEKRVLELVKSELSKEIEKMEIVSREMKGDRVAALLIFPDGEEGKVKDFVWKEGLSELKLPEKYEGLGLEETLEAIEKDLSLLPDELERVRRKKEKFAFKNWEKLVLLRKRVTELLEKLVAKEKYSNVSELAFLIRAWAPVREIERIKKALIDRFEESLHVEIIKPKKREYSRVPVSLRNPIILRPFELLLSIFQPPIYGTVDPTPFLFAFFPFFFGFMLGDLGYGAVGTILFLLLFFKSKKGSALRGMATLFLWAMGWTLVFGFLYGELFGNLGEKLGLKPILIHRTHHVMPVLIAAIIFGVIQVLLGLILGVYNNLRIGHGKHALNEFLRFAGLSGLIISVLGAVGKLPKISVLVGGSLLLLAMVITIFVHGLAGPLEVLSAAGNILSYARLMAIGMSSAILGMIANTLGGMMGFVIFSIIIALVFHALNLVLGIFDPTVQGLRLQFVEFFSKFYISGGRPYRPFKKGGGNYVS